MNIVKRISTAATAAAAVGLILAPASLADTGCVISGNGNRSHNRCVVRVHRTTAGSTQVNSAVVTNTVGITSNTGGNTASKNTGGNVNVDSGNSSVTVTITNNVNSNSTGGTP